MRRRRPVSTPIEAQIVVAKERMPRTISLLLEYPEGAQRQRAYDLVSAAVEEATAYVEEGWRDRVLRLCSSIGGATLRTVNDYLKPSEAP